MAIVLESRFTQGSDPRALPERRGARPARTVRDSRRRRGRAHLLRQGRAATSRWPRPRRIAGVIQSPSRLSPFRNRRSARASGATSCCTRWPTSGYRAAERRGAAAKAAARVAARALENEAPYFVDYVSQLVDEDYAGLLEKDAAVDVYTTLDLHLQRIAQEAVAKGIAAGRQAAGGARKKQPSGQPQVALVAVDPRTGEILAMVGGRCLQPVAVQPRRRRAAAAGFGVQAVRLSGGVRADGRRRPRRSHAGDRRRSTSRRRSRTARTTTRPATTRTSTTGRSRCAARWRCRATSSPSKSPRSIGYDEVADLWKRVGVGTPAKAFPSIALGVFEGTPVEMATAYTLFTNNGTDPAAAGDRRASSRTASARRCPRAATDATDRPARHDLPRHEHDAQRHQRRHRRRRARRRLHARRGRQDRHDQRPARRVVHRLHAGAADRRLGGLRRQPADRPQRVAGGAADLDVVHEARARRRGRACRSRCRPASSSPTSTGHGQARDAELPVDLPRGVSRRHRAA